MSGQEASKAAGSTLHSKEVDAAPSQPGAGLCGDNTGRLGGSEPGDRPFSSCHGSNSHSIDVSLKEQGWWPPAGHSP